MYKLKSICLCLFSVFLFCFTCLTSLSAAPIGELFTADGEKYLISQFGSKAIEKNYSIKTESGFVPIENIQHITRINTEGNRFTYLIVLVNGDYARGRQGLLFYENVSYTDPATGKLKHAYSPVIKDRQQNGLIFTAQSNSQNNHASVFEISNPNIIDRISLYSHQQTLSEETSDNVENRLLTQK